MHRGLISLSERCDKGFRFYESIANKNKKERNDPKRDSLETIISPIPKRQSVSVSMMTIMLHAQQITKNTIYELLQITGFDLLNELAAGDKRRRNH